MAAGVEAELHIAVDAIFPNQVLLPAIADFAEAYPGTRIELEESIISGAADLVRHGRVQLAITPHVPQGWLGDHLLRLEFVCVASPQHPLHQLGRPLTDRDLQQHRQLVVRDSGERRDLNVGWLHTEQRLTVSTMGTRIQALCQGLGFAWSPLLKISGELERGLLKPLPLEHGTYKFADLYMVITDAEGAGPATQAMAEAIRRQVRSKEARGHRVKCQSNNSGTLP